MPAPQALEDMKNKILLRRKALEAALETVNYKIKNLHKYFSAEQRRCWYVHRRNLREQLDLLPTEAMIQKNAKRINYSNSTKF